MKVCPDRTTALALLKKYNAEPFHIQHALTVEGAMRWYASELGYGEDVPQRVAPYSALVYDLEIVAIVKK